MPPRVPAPKPAVEEARQRLLHAGLKLFAQHGFAKTTTRELAEAAQVNVAAISYYFGDKAGLYRGVFVECANPVDEEIARFAGPGLSLHDALRGLYGGFVDTLRRGEEARLFMKLYFREMLEPTGVWQETIDNDFRPQHQALLAVLAQQMGAVEPDRELQRLAICLAGLGVHLHVGYDITNQLAPGLNDGQQALDEWTEALTRYALALVQAEALRRGLPSPGAGDNTR